MIIDEYSLTYQCKTVRSLSIDPYLNIPEFVDRPIDNLLYYISHGISCRIDKYSVEDAVYILVQLVNSLSMQDIEFLRNKTLLVINEL